MQNERERATHTYPPIAWFSHKGLRWQGIRFDVESGRGIFVVAKRSLPPNGVVAAIPAVAMLSRKTAGCSATRAALQDLLNRGLPSIECLSLAIAIEQAAGRRSSWFAYLRSLPRAEPLPHLWSAEELCMLAGTGLDEVSYKRKRRLVENFRAATEAWMAEPSLLPSLEAYLNATTLASSRAYFVNAENGEALVPLADLLNHKCALLDNGDDGEHGIDHEDCEEFEEGQDVERDEESCDGEEGVEDEESSNGEEGQENEETDVGEEGEEGVDIERVADEAVDERGGMELRPDVKVLFPEGDDCSDALLVTQRAFRAGEELCKTYDELGNWELLAGYGFTLEYNPFNTALLRWVHIARAASTAIGERQFRSRVRALRAVGWWKQLLGHDFVFDRRATPPAELLMVLRLFTAAQPLPSWVLGSTSADVTERKAVIASFHAASATEQLRLASSPAPRLASARAILLSAFRAQLAGYARPKARTGVESAKQLHASRVVADEVALWTAAIWLADRGFPQRRAISNKHLRHQFDLEALEPWEVQAAAHAFLKRRRL
mmetsp:Transcript_24562/g.40714  ORF Transcript_24562/g.40714 Transcript_24562/m.40714 type:complete len:550 (+) Transcript_24562:259-1908(+)|eukprot:CAMPEP_0119324560 /NCGR_PEP_ID=MMETSP1333-20130426/63591_1 /TAXON_ID=418940 /ORGANISM="Scyphosphaera apsteinii, Strain RCC1455" /LENGTH=549 /DNA_ID=CAMNT_0007332291 /DNA_START=259 /DNA_END=1908 /DNA_ORIENTATION=-